MTQHIVDTLRMGGTTVRTGHALSESQTEGIQRLAGRGVTPQTLARRYQISLSHVRKIIRGIHQGS